VPASAAAFASTFQSSLSIAFFALRAQAPSRPGRCENGSTAHSAAFSAWIRIQSKKSDSHFLTPPQCLMISVVATSIGPTTGIRINSLAFLETQLPKSWSQRRPSTSA
jgi:hypothetical protein